MKTRMAEKQRRNKMNEKNERNTVDIKFAAIACQDYEEGKRS